MSVILGLDLGERRIGVAISDGDGAPARPLVTVRRGRGLEGDVEALRSLVDRHGASELVVGLPLDMSGVEGTQAQATRAWASAIATDLRLPLTLQDERLTSQLAEDRIGPMKRGRSGGPPSKAQRDAHRARVDREAAAIILQDVLDARSGGSAARPGIGRNETTESHP